jgi:DNA-binding CsgD family transcriptional regulator
LATLEGRAEQRAWLLYRIGRLLRHWDQAQAIIYLDEAVRHADVVGDQALAAYAQFDLGHVRVKARDFERGLAEMAAGDAALSALGDAAFDRDDVVAWVADALPQDTARPRGGQRPRPTHHINSRRGTHVMFLLHPGHFQRAIELGEPYLEAAPPVEELSDLVLSSVGDCWGGLAQAYAALGRPEQALEAFGHATDAFRRIDHHFMIGIMATCVLRDVIIPYYTTQLDERRRRAAEEAIALTQAGGALSMAPLHRTGHLALRLVEGAWREAREHATAARQTLTGASARDHATVDLAVLARNQGEPELAWSLVREVLGQGPTTAPGTTNFNAAVQLQRVAAALALDHGDLAAAHDWLTAHDRWLEWSGIVRGRAEGALLWAQCHQATGDHQAAQSHANRALQLASDPRQPLALVAIHRLLGQLDMSAEGYPDAERHLLKSLALAEACAAPFERALTLLALAELRAATGTIDEARALVDEAHAICAPLGAIPTLARVDALRSQLLRKPAPTSYPAGLTAREAQVLRLVAQGLTDAEVAERLFLARRTVNTHLTSIYTKLGVNSRAAATRFAVENGIT